jgi:hypothetical protein
VSYFNAEQEAHMDYLATIPPAQRCWSGWGLLPDRVGCCGTLCPADASLADNLATRQPCCGRPAPRPDFPFTTGSHYAGCTPRYRDAFAIDLGLIDVGGEG